MNNKLEIIVQDRQLAHTNTVELGYYYLSLCITSAIGLHIPHKACVSLPCLV